MNDLIDLSRLDTTVFYAMDKAIKSYRQFAQRNIKKQDLDITIDQWLVLKTIKDDPELTQKQIAKKVFKDFASITRMIELLVKRQYVTRSFHDQDRRRFHLQLSAKGLSIYKHLLPVISANRARALADVTDLEIRQLQAILAKITSNCMDQGKTSAGKKRISQPK